MKKTIILLFLLAFTLAGFSQGLLRPVPADLFQKARLKGWEYKAAGTFNTVLLPRLNTGVICTSFGKNYGPVEFSAIGFGIGLLRYKDNN